MAARTAWLRTVLALCFAGVALAAIGWYYLMPHGFPPSHPRFWVNSVLPPAAVLTCAVGIVAVVRKQAAVLKCLTLLFAANAVVAGAVGRALFRESVSGMLLAVVAVCAGFSVLVAALTFWRFAGRAVPAWLKALCICVGVAIGAFLPWSQRSADPATRPCGSPMPPPLPAVERAPYSIAISDEVRVLPDMAGVSIERDGTSVAVHPLLSFRSRSPDRFWTLFAPRSSGSRAKRSLTGLSEGTETISLQYQDDGRSHLRVSASEPEGALRVEAFSELPRPVWSHLNSFCQLHLCGRQTLALSFSPCPTIVQMRRADYPVGRPSRLAYVDGHGLFRVVEARSGEKGPFDTLAEGPLRDDEPLQITVHDGNRAVYRLTFYDWAKQASRQLSPTAGWRLPENAIEFALTNDGSPCEGVVFITLAATSVGRGWDSVGHTAGTYCNTMSIQPVPTNGQPERPPTIRER